MYDLKTWFLLFMIYAFIGWIIEEIVNLVTYKKIINRGFLIGPYCPIYGYGSVFIIFFDYYTDFVYHIGMIVKSFLYNYPIALP